MVHQLLWLHLAICISIASASYYTDGAYLNCTSVLHYRTSGSCSSMDTSFPHRQTTDYYFCTLSGSGLSDNGVLSFYGSTGISTLNSGTFCNDWQQNYPLSEGVWITGDVYRLEYEIIGGCEEKAESCHFVCNSFCTERKSSW